MSYNNNSLGVSMYLGGISNVPGAPGNIGGMNAGYSPNPQLAFDPMGAIRDALDTGRRNFGSLYSRTDAEYFGGRLPGGSTPPRTFVDTLPQAPNGPGFYNMPGTLNQIPMGDGFIGPRSTEQLRREALEQIRLEDEENRKYSSDPNLARSGFSSTPLASMYGSPQMGQLDQYPAAAAGFLNKRVIS